MDRRHFLHSVNSIGVGALWPVTATTPPKLSRTHTPANSSLRNEGPGGCRVGVVGVGGAGVSVLSALLGRLPNCFRMIAINTEASSLQNMLLAERKILVGGVPDRPVRSDDARRSVVRRNAWSAAAQITEAVAGLDVVLFVAGMGGVAGTVISPVVAQMTRKLRILSIGIPILPFDWEGQGRNQIARDGVGELGQYVDSLFPISSDAIAQSAGENPTLDDVFCKVSMEVRMACQRALDAAQRSQLKGDCGEPNPNGSG